MSTYQQIAEGAYAKSLKNRPGEIATESTELLTQIHRLLTRFFLLAARINKYRMAVPTVVSPMTPGEWPRPTNATRVWLVEKDSDGSVVHIVPPEDRGAVGTDAAIAPVGTIYYSVGADPAATDILVFFHNVTPTVPTALTDALDPLWPEAFDEMLMVDVARYLAAKDGPATRDGEVAEFEQQLLAWGQLFIQHLQNLDDMSRRWGHVDIINSSEAVPLLREFLGIGGSS